MVFGIFGAEDEAIPCGCETPVQYPGHECSEMEVITSGGGRTNDETQLKKEGSECNERVCV